MTTEMEPYDGAILGAPAYEPPERNWIEEIRAWIDKAIDETGGTYHARVLASHIVNDLKDHDPELLLGFVRTQAEELIYTIINKRDRSVRSHARAVRPRSLFAAAAKAAESGNTEALSEWLNTPFTTIDNLRKPLGQMNRVELTYTAEQYEDRANRNRMNAALLRVLARRLKEGQVVADIWTETEIVQSWENVQAGD